MSKPSYSDRASSLPAGAPKVVAACGVLLMTLWFAACSGTARKLQSDGPLAASNASSRESLASAVSMRPPLMTSVGADADAVSDADTLGALRQSRSRGGADYDFGIGAGDVIEISVPAIEELKDRTVRVSGDNSSGLPLIGVIEVGGMTEEQLRDALKLHLRRYMYNPQLEVFVKEYRTRQIAISGAVKNPGVYTLASPSDTILEMISRAGGMTEEASPRIILIPGMPPQSAPVRSSVVQSSDDAVSSSAARLLEVASLAPVLPGLPLRSLADKPGTVESPRLMPVTTKSDLAPVIIDVSNISSQKGLELPARPGDVVIVPPAGQVVVQGWVQNPGAYKVTSGMTVLGAVGAAGGTLFSKSAEILRTGSNGERIDLPVDLSDGQNGKNADLPVQAGDVLVVRRSVTGSVPYFLYLVFTKFGTGIYLPVP